MPFTANDFLEPVLPFLPESLVGPAAVAAVRTLTRHLPPAQSGGFECPLGESLPEADFALCYVPESSSRTPAPVGRWNQATLDTLAFTETDWARVQALFQAMTDPDSPLCERVQNVWLEFDMADGRTGVPLPSVFFSLNSQDQWPELLVHGLHLLARDRWPAYLTANLSRCFAALPSAARIFQAGMMLSRQVSSVRLSINRFAPEAIPGYLQATGWTGPVADLADLLARLAGFASDIMLDLDVDETVGLKVGLECYMDDPRRARVVPQWPVFLEFLVERGLCVPGKRDALLAWPGYSSGQLFGTLIFPRGLNHIKIVYEPHRPLTAKAYLFFWNGWMHALPFTS